MKKKLNRSNKVELTEQEIKLINDAILLMNRLEDNLDIECENELIDKSGKNIYSLLEELEESIPDNYTFDFKKEKIEHTDSKAWECPPGVDPDAFYGNFQ